MLGRSCYLFAPAPYLPEVGLKQSCTLLNVTSPSQPLLHFASAYHNITSKYGTCHLGSQPWGHAVGQVQELIYVRQPGLSPSTHQVRRLPTCHDPLCVLGVRWHGGFVGLREGAELDTEAA